jgi:hypothetical protein
LLKRVFAVDVAGTISAEDVLADRLQLGAESARGGVAAPLSTTSATTPDRASSSSAGGGVELRESFARRRHRLRRPEPARADQRTTDDRIETDCESSAACPTVNVRSLAMIESGERTGYEDKTNRSVVDVATQQGCDDEAQASRPTASQAKHQCT